MIHDFIHFFTIIGSMVFSIISLFQIYQAVEEENIKKGFIWSILLFISIFGLFSSFPQGAYLSGAIILGLVTLFSLMCVIDLDGIDDKPKRIIWLINFVICLSLLVTLYKQQMEDKFSSKTQIVSPVEKP